MLTPQQQTDATVAKLSQMVADAHAKAMDTHTEDITSRQYWLGFEGGLKRAIMVVQGRG